MRPILHIDMDQFFVAVELLDRPDLRGKPVVVGSPPDKRGVVSTASYEARKFGVHSAMPSRTAGKLCPHAVFLPVRMERYLEVSEQVMKVLESFTPMIEQVSVDEAFLDVRGAMRRWKDPVALAEALRERIRNEIGITASVGVAPNKFLAKLGSDMRKPDGLTVVPDTPEEIVAFLAPLPVGRIWGVGKKSAERLKQAGITTVRDVQRRDVRFLEAVVGPSFAAHIHALAHGIDDRPVVTSYEAKSVSSETTFDEDCTDREVIHQTLIGLAEHVGRRLRASGRKGRIAHIKLRYEDFSTLTRQMSLGTATNADRRLIAAGLELMGRENLDRPVRLIGFGISSLGDEASPGELYLFQEFSPAREDERDARLDRAVDAVRAKFGDLAVRRGR